MPKSKAVKKKSVKKKGKKKPTQKTSKSTRELSATQKKRLVTAFFVKDRVICENTDLARELYNQSRYGAVLDDKSLQLTFLEALYLLDKKKIILLDGRKKEIDYDKFQKKATRLESNFWVRYCVFRDFRNRGYIIKTALKFGADFRVYDRGIKPGEDHAKWIVYPVREADVLTWYEFSSKNRVAHSTRKRLLIGCVDEEGDCTYWEVAWRRP